ncbi:hypothetical protein PROFUN_13701 [Planoprotostelium fungivorum]|uniref:Alpha-mannosidase n=1 Tax=Planoprotostelium fungivorum TaxID=1890364 RepID=A0A2P6N3A4_9EUKA|nr:hypothetical protein PROFUN_13701 [Planoprotostelium fungivorum]
MKGQTRLAWLITLLLLFSLSISGDLLEVHLLPHSHCDVGWLKTSEQLSLDPSKTFHWAEISFLKQWWTEQNEDQRKKFTRLVANGQIEFVGGGYVMHDEATASVDAIINQMSDGHEWLRDHFDVTPRIAWQIDAFGHSSLTPVLFSQMGYDYLVLNRIHHYLKDAYREEKQLQFIWEASPSLKERHSMFSHILYDHYSTKAGNYSFDWEKGDDIINDENIAHRSEQLINLTKTQGESYRTKQIMMPWGDDFSFVNAKIQYDNMDRLMKYINDNNSTLGVTMRYSTLSKYFDRVRESAERESIEFPIYRYDDFLPYADTEESYYTGYYSSRSQIKRDHRESLALLRQSQIFHSLAQNEVKVLTKILKPPNFDSILLRKKLNEARRELDVITHHQAITGTSKSYVMEDYTQATNRSRGLSRQVIEISMETLLTRDGIRPTLSLNRNTDPFKEGECRSIVATNSLAWNKRETLCVDVDTEDMSVFDREGELASQTIPIFLEKRGERKHFQFCFLAVVPPLGAKTFSLCRVTSSNVSASSIVEVYEKIEKGEKGMVGEMMIENEHHELRFGGGGYLKSLYDKGSDRLHDLTTTYREYSTTRGGAYLFTPRGEATEIDNTDNVMHIYRGPLIQEAVLFCGQHNIVRVRLTWHDKGGDISERKVSIRHSVKSSSSDRDLIVRYNTEITPEGILSADNGVEMVERNCGEVEEVEKRYYPLQTTAFIRDDSDVQLTILSRSTLGATVNPDGSMELMLHRSSSVDDNRGLNESMVDDTISSHDHLLFLEDHSITEWRRKRMFLDHEHPLLLLHVLNREAQFSSSFFDEYEPLRGSEFPQNLHLYSFEHRGEKSEQMIVRLGHIYESNIISQLSQPMDVHLERLFFPEAYEMKNINRTMLTLHDVREKLEWKVNREEEMIHLARSDVAESSPLTFDDKSEAVETLRPTEIHTFLMELSPTTNTSKQLAWKYSTLQQHYPITVPVTTKTSVNIIQNFFVMLTFILASLAFWLTRRKRQTRQVAVVSLRIDLDVTLCPLLRTTVKIFRLCRCAEVNDG